MAIHTLTLTDEDLDLLKFALEQHRISLETDPEEFEEILEESVEEHDEQIAALERKIATQTGAN